LEGSELISGRRLPEVDLVHGRKATQIIEPVMVGDSGVEFHGLLFIPIFIPALLWYYP
jgi:hypothetical protein